MKLKPTYVQEDSVMAYEVYYAEGYVRKLCMISGGVRGGSSSSFWFTNFEDVSSNSDLFNIPTECHVPHWPESNKFSLDWPSLGHLYFNLPNKLMSESYGTDEQIFCQETSAFIYNEVDHHLHEVHL
ncbi:hypothetical protein GEMRC1_001835 [Eukaryota sp. GEM-RC1]